MYSHTCMCIHTYGTQRQTVEELVEVLSYKSWILTPATAKPGPSYQNERERNRKWGIGTENSLVGVCVCACVRFSKLLSQQTDSKTANYFVYLLIYWFNPSQSCARIHSLSFSVSSSPLSLTEMFSLSISRHVLTHTHAYTHTHTATCSVSLWV